MNDDMLQTAATRRIPSASRLTCAQCERMLLDAADEVLLPEDQAQFDRHLAGCESCSRAMADAQRGHAWLGMLHAAPPEPPVALLSQILARTSGDPAIRIPLRPRNEPILSYAGTTVLASNSALDGGTQTVLAFGPVPRGNWFGRLFASVSQPRFAMTAAMAFFSIALTLNLTGVRLRDLRASSFTPTSIRHSFWTTNARVFRYYDNLRVVYELESRVREVQRDTEDNAPRSAPPPTAAPVPAAPQKGTAPRSTEPRSSNPASRNQHLLATVDVPSHPHLSTLPPTGSLTASAAPHRGEGARA